MTLNLHDRINKTHIMLAGGFAAAYRFSDPTKKNIVQTKVSPAILVGGGGANPRNFDANPNLDLAVDIDLSPSSTTPIGPPDGDAAKVADEDPAPDEAEVNTEDTGAGANLPGNPWGEAPFPQQPFVGGGISLKRTWLYDGLYWMETADMSVPRDRPACSLVELPDGQVL